MELCNIAPRDYELSLLFRLSRLPYGVAWAIPQGVAGWATTHMSASTCSAWIITLETTCLFPPKKRVWSLVMVGAGMDLHHLLILLHAPAHLQGCSELQNVVDA